MNRVGLGTLYRQKEDRLRRLNTEEEHVVFKKIQAAGTLAGGGESHATADKILCPVILFTSVSSVRDAVSLLSLVRTWFSIYLCPESLLNDSPVESSSYISSHTILSRCSSVCSSDISLCHLSGGGLSAFHSLDTVALTERNSMLFSK